MNKTTISFLSTRGRAMNIDLKLIQDYLASNLSDITLEYYLKNTATKIPAANKQLETARLSFCNNTSNIICMDPSIPVKLSPALPEERRLLTLVPYDYLFNEYLKFTENPELAHKKTFFRCTHVLPGSPFFSNFLKNFYEFENATFLDDMCLPLAWDITAKESKENVRNSLEYLYPEAKGKKILTILTVNQTTPEEMTELFSDLNLKKFLDEIGDLSLQMQVKLLRFLQEKTFSRVGSNRELHADVRFIAATSRNLEELMAANKFREDLYYRLNIFPIVMPDLSKRKGDVMLLAEHFLSKFNLKYGKDIKRLSTPAINMLMAYHWPGNVRELENCMERAVITAQDDCIYGYNLPASLQMPSHDVPYSRDGEAPADLPTMVDSFERELIVAALKRSPGNMSAAARELGISPRVLHYKMHRLGLQKS